MFDPNTGQDDGTDQPPDDWGHFYDHPGVPSPITADMVKQLYAKYYPGYKPTDAEIQSHLGHPGGVQGLTKFFEDQSKGYVQPPAAPTPPPGGGGNTGGPVGGDLFPPYAPYVAPTPRDLPSAPGFTAPAPFSYENFSAPTLDQAKAEPGYQMALGEGLQAIQQSAAGRGLLRTGGTLKDINNYASAKGEQNYQNVFNRAADLYSTNFNTAKAAYQSRYQSALDEFAPKEQAYLTGTNATLTQNQNDASNAWGSYYGQNALDLNRRNSILNGWISTTQ